MEMEPEKPPLSASNRNQGVFPRGPRRSVIEKLLIRDDAQALSRKRQQKVDGATLGLHRRRNPRFGYSVNRFPRDTAFAPGANGASCSEIFALSPPRTMSSCPAECLRGFLSPPRRAYGINFCARTCSGVLPRQPENRRAQLRDERAPPTNSESQLIPDMYLCILLALHPRGSFEDDRFRQNCSAKMDPLNWCAS